MNFIFVGERPSPLAAKMGVSWKDGRLAARQLFDALRAADLDPVDHKFDNVFRPVPTGPEEVCPNAIRRIRYAASRGRTVIAMGQKATAVLQERGISCVTIVHPAARGKIRKKARYAAHVRSVLTQVTP